MEWTVNEGLYHRFMKWRLKCENILECEFASTSRASKMQESCRLVWGFWDGLVCVLKPSQGRPQLGHNLGTLCRILQVPSK